MSPLLASMRHPFWRPCVTPCGVLDSPFWRPFPLAPMSSSPSVVQASCLLASICHPLWRPCAAHHVVPSGVPMSSPLASMCHPIWRACGTPSGVHASHPLASICYPSSVRASLKSLNQAKGPLQKVQKNMKPNRHKLMGKRRFAHGKRNTHMGKH